MKSYAAIKIVLTNILMIMKENTYYKILGNQTEQN